MAFKDLTLPNRIVAVHVDFMKHKDFCILGGVTQIGKVSVDDTVTTAATNGEDVYYNPEFIADMSRKQLRYLVGHENMHKALHHCTEYMAASNKYPEEMAQAADYVVNWQLESMDTGTEKFLERPTSIPPLVNAKYADMSILEVLRDLLKNPPPPSDKPMDEHKPGDKPGEPGEGEGDEVKSDVKQRIEDAVRHGEIMQQQMRGAADGAAKALSGFRESRTDWRGPLRRFVQEICEGDEQSRFSPPNKRMLPLGIILPSHFSEATGELIVACDTSGSMTYILPTVFGEIARIAQTVLPTSLRVIWWDTKVRGEQVFTPRDYANIAKLTAPSGGGGTTVSCVAAYIKEKAYRPKATILLSDGWIEASYEPPAGNLLWGIVNNRRFVPVRGKVLHIQED